MRQRADCGCQRPPDDSVEQQREREDSLNQPTGKTSALLSAVEDGLSDGA